jgi:hypothetical protein
MSSSSNERQKYRIEKPVGVCNYAREGAKSEDLKSYTGDEVNEFWCDVLFRKHKYFVQEEYDTSNMAMQNSYDGMPSKRAFRYFQTTDIPTPGLHIPEVIQHGKWSDPSKINTWRDKFQETHRVGEWGIYAEHYEDEEQRVKREQMERERAERERLQAETEKKRQELETERIIAELDSSPDELRAFREWVEQQLPGMSRRFAAGREKRLGLLPSAPQAAHMSALLARLEHVGFVGE